ncbi:MAG TPA: hypothetical protein VEX13_08700 [Chloroflexia bacterium]|nr:hypothetical protein [Chloroflexia bacterium]
MEHQEIVNRIQTRIEDPLASKRLATLIERVVRTELGLVFYFMNIALASVFFAYFSVLFNLLLDDSVIRLWIGNTYFLPKLALFGQEFYDPFSGPVSNVTIFFSIMTAGIANVQIVADEQRRKDLIRFSSERATRLMGMSALLRAVNQELSNKPTAANNAAK